MSEHDQRTPEDGGSVLERVIAEYLAAVARNESPDRDKILADYPEIAEPLREFFQNLDTPSPAPEKFGRDTSRGEDDATIPPRPKTTPRVASLERTIDTEDDRQPDDDPPQINRPACFGDFELLDEIARGGMGVVYRARQISLNRTVALKMILAGQLASEEDVKRFYAEAEAAAHLDHPGIVPVFEVGQHDGQHYFSMGFVEGTSLADQVAQGPLEAEHAADLIRRIARAIDYAHQHGVIHRDLKPANVLLDEDGQPRVTDFGLAKRMEQDSGLTGTGQILGTPGYMAPEQAKGKVKEVGPAADVYALGALLYCLLTGRPPFQAANPIDTMLQVLESEPIAPRALNAHVPADLETICLKALDKLPTRRYESAAALGDELQRYLDGEPILARPIGAASRAWRWCRRKPVVAGLIAATSASLIVGLLLSSYFAVLANNRAGFATEQKQRADDKAQDALQQQAIAERALAAESEANLRSQRALQAETLANQQAKAAVDNYVDLILTDAVLRERRLQPLRRRLLTDALHYYQWLIDQSRGRAEGQYELGIACVNLGRIHMASGSVDEAEQSLQQARGVFESLIADESDAPEFRDHLADTLNLLGRTAQEQARFADARRHYQEAIELRAKLVEDDPAATRFRVGLASDFNNLGELLRKTGDHSAAEQHYRQAIDLKTELLELEPQNEAHLDSLGNSYNNLGLVQLTSIRDSRVALATLQTALDIRKRLADRVPDNRTYRKNLGDTYFNLGFVYHNHVRDAQRSLELYSAAEDLHTELVEDEPNVAAYRFVLAKDLLNLGQLHHQRKEFEQAVVCIDRSIELHRELVVEQPSVVEFRLSLCDCLDSRAQILRSRSRFSDAAQTLEESIGMRQQLVDSHPDDLDIGMQLAFGHYQLGDLLFNETGELESALTHWQAEADLRLSFIHVRPEDAHLRRILGGNLNNVAMVLEDLGRTEDALRGYEQAIEHQLRALQGAPSNRQSLMFLDNHYQGLIRTQRETGRFSEAVGTAGEIARRSPDDPERLYVVGVELAQCANAYHQSWGDESPSESQQRELDRYVSETMAMLDRAVTAGFRDGRRVERESSFDLFRQDERFARFANLLDQ